MAIDYTSKETKDLETIVANCRRLNRTNDQRFLAATQELKRRNPDVLEGAKSWALILATARAGHFLSYGQLAAASGMKWTALVRRQMQSHLGALVSDAHEKGWPMLSAIVVDKPNVLSGRMEPGALKGFIKAAHDLGRRDIDPDSSKFLLEEQRRLFRYAQEHADP